MTDALVHLSAGYLHTLLNLTMLLLFRVQCGHLFLCSLFLFGRGGGQRITPRELFVEGFGPSRQKLPCSSVNICVCCESVIFSTVSEILGICAYALKFIKYFVISFFDSQLSVWCRFLNNNFGWPFLIKNVYICIDLYYVCISGFCHLPMQFCVDVSKYSFIMLPSV